MSEEVLKALMQLFAIISKQDDGTSAEERLYVERFLKLQLTEDAVQEYLMLFEKHAGLDAGSLAKAARRAAKTQKEKQENKEKKPKQEKKLTSVKDSVRTLGICKKINKTLTQRQKIVVLVRLFELINAEKKITEQRVAIIETTAKVFNISAGEYRVIERFVLQTEPNQLNCDEILLAAASSATGGLKSRFIETPNLDGTIILLRIRSVELFMVKYSGQSQVNLNGRLMHHQRIYLFANGSSIRPPSGKPIYYSDVVAHFMKGGPGEQLTFYVNKITYTFPNGEVGLNKINLAETEGKLIGLMGASGAGKTTLLNVMAGIFAPAQGQVLLNGIDLHKETKKQEGVIGYIPQDDLLIEELTVFQNLYYNAKLCLNHLSEKELIQKVAHTLHSLGLSDYKNQRVGSPLDKTISGGQRKRLNIALEFIREPSVLFVDEPTSGLSSRDSENVMDLLRELILKGKLVFVVIHQPSSDIYKLFDKMVILDKGGWQVYYGNPVEALMYFKRIDHQVNAGVGECTVCGSVNPEQIFNILESRVVDEYGRFTDHRKIKPEGWHRLYKENFTQDLPEVVEDKPPGSLHRPHFLKQFGIFFTRDILAKAGNKQYVYLNVFISPILAFILSVIVRYTSSNSGIYLFRENDNIPAYIFMCIIVSLFIGLTVSAEEIYRDRRMLKREAFLNLSRGSYLFSKLAILFSLSLFQSGVFTLIGNSILEFPGMFMYYWMMLFTVSCFANVLGLNISSAFNSPVTIYILIPIILIPQMILGGAMFDFDKLNRMLGREGAVPVLAEFMAARWAYEGLMVNQFVHNDFEKQFYRQEQMESLFDYKNAYYIPELQKRFQFVKAHYKSENDSVLNRVREELALLRHELAKEAPIHAGRLPDPEYKKLTPESFDADVMASTDAFLAMVAEYYTVHFNDKTRAKSTLLDALQNTPEKRDSFLKARNVTQNEYLADLVRKKFAEDKIIRDGKELVQIMGPVYRLPTAHHLLDFRTHFYAPKKHLLGRIFDTFYFNLSAIWAMAFLLYVALYFDILKKILYLISRFEIDK